VIGDGCWVLRKPLLPITHQPTPKPLCGLEGQLLLDRQLRARAVEELDPLGDDDDATAVLAALTILPARGKDESRNLKDERACTAVDGYTVIAS
jgi:hypothetical protein